MSARIVWRMSVMVILCLLGGAFGQVDPTFFGKSTTGVFDTDGQTKLQGNGSGGDLVLHVGDSAVTLTAAPAGVVLPLAVTAVLPGTAATGLVLLGY